MKRFILSLLNVLSFIFLIYTSVTIDASAVFTIDTPPLVMPADYAFSIWLLIYLGLLIFVISQFFVSPTLFVLYEKIAYFFAPALILTAASLFVQPVVAPFVIAGSLLMLIFLYLSVQSFGKQLKVKRQMHLYQKWQLVRSVFSLYIGWVSVALIVNISTVLKSLGFMNLLGLSELLVAIVVLVLGGLLAIYFCQTQRDRVYSLVFIWAYVAIAVAHLNLYPIAITSCGVILMMAFFLDVGGEDEY